MDLDLVLDLYGFLPEKFFVGKMFRGRTRLTFVDYERFYYEYKEKGIYKWWRHIRYSGSNQEYGPADITKYQIIYAFPGRKIRYIMRDKKCWVVSNGILQEETFDPKFSRIYFPE